MSAAPRSIPRYTAEEYAAWEGRWELLDGQWLPYAGLDVPPGDKLAHEFPRDSRPTGSGSRPPPPAGRRRRCSTN